MKFWVKVWVKEISGIETGHHSQYNRKNSKNHRLKELYKIVV